MISICNPLKDKLLQFLAEFFLSRASDALQRQLGSSVCELLQHADFIAVARPKWELRLVVNFAPLAVRSFALLGRDLFKLPDTCCPLYYLFQPPCGDSLAGAVVYQLQIVGGEGRSNSTSRSS